jgi:transposase InsO family protein
MANRNQAPAYPAKMRKKWYYLVDKLGKSVSEICEVYDISKKTYYKWRSHDLGSVNYIGRREHPETKIKGSVRILIYEEKEKTNYGPLKMKLLIKRKLNIDVSTTAIYKFYKKKGLIRKPQKKLAWYQPLKEPLKARYPGDVVQLDAKYIWEDNIRKYQRTFIDIYTGMQFADITTTMTAEDTINAYLNAEKFFPFKILGIQNDNGGENRGEFHKFLGEKGVAHYFIPKCSPQWDGSVERAHGVIDQEYYLNPRRTWKSLNEYLMWYNYERIHLGKYLNGMIPIEKWQNYQLKVSPLKVN